MIRGTKALLWFVLLLLGPGCVAFRSEMQGGFEGEAPPDRGREPVTAFFEFRHLRQAHGYDAIPKQSPRASVADFDDLFKDAVRRLSNLERYTTYTDVPADSGIPERLETKARLREGMQYRIEMSFLRETRFVSQFLAGTVSTLTLTLFPTLYTTDYSMEVVVFDDKGARIADYSRSSRVSECVQMFLLFAYPFHPTERKMEEVYVEFLHDVFRQIEAEGVLGSSG